MLVLLIIVYYVWLDPLNCLKALPKCCFCCKYQIYDSCIVKITSVYVFVTACAMTGLVCTIN